MKTELRPLSPQDGRDVYEFLQLLPAEEAGYGNSAHGLTYEEFKTWLIQMDEYAHGIHMPDWMVPSTEYWFLVDDVIVGNIRLRHELNEGLRKNGGHIGYAIAAPYRKNGYAKAMLKAVLEEAKKLGLQEVMLTANCDNMASRKTIEANGGILEKEDGEHAFYWINLSN